MTRARARRFGQPVQPLGKGGSLANLHHVLSVSKWLHSVNSVYRGGEKRIRYDNIVRIKIPTIRCFGGWLKAISQSDAIRLTVMVEITGALVKRLKGELDRRGLEQRCDRTRMMRFLKTAVYADQSCERIYEGFWRFVLLILISLAVGVVFALLTGVNAGVALIWILVAWLWPFVAYFVTEFAFGWRLKDLTDEESSTCPERDVQWETRITRLAFLAGSLVFLGLSVIFYPFLLTAP